MSPDLPTPWQALDAASALQWLRRDAGVGLSPADEAQDATVHGPNALPEPPKR